jgi:excisionase family DNA binding protein
MKDLSDEILTIFEVVRITKFSVQTLRGYVHHKQIPFHKVNRAIRFRASEIEQWIERGGKCGETAVRQGDFLFGHEDA